MIAQAETPAAPRQDMPAMAATMPLPGLHTATPRVVPTSADDPRGPLAAADVTPAEKSLLEKLRDIRRGRSDLHRAAGRGSARHERDCRHRSGVARPGAPTFHGRTLANRAAVNNDKRRPCTPAAVPTPAIQPGVATSDSWQPNTGIRRFR